MWADEPTTKLESMQLGMRRLCICQVLHIPKATSYSRWVRVSGTEGFGADAFTF
jgi:hypothetical protein